MPWKTISALFGCYLSVSSFHYTRLRTPWFECSKGKLSLIMDWEQTINFAGSNSNESHFFFLFRHSAISKLWFIKRYKNTSFSIVSTGAIKFYLLAFGCVAVRIKVPT